MAVKPLDTLLAIKALNLAPGLIESDRRVGTALIEHFNRDTERCDPGHARLSNLLALSTRTIIRCEKRLVAGGLFRVDRHGGFSGRNSYEPLWNKFRAVLQEWNVRFQSQARGAGRSAVSPASRQRCHVAGDTGVTQTYRKNLLNKPAGQQQPREGLRNFSRRSFAPASGDVVRNAAERRWNKDLHDTFVKNPSAYSEAIAAIDDEMQKAATDAELQRQGAGLAYILDRLRFPRSSA